MAIIHLLDDADMPTDVLALAREVERQYGFIPNILRGVANCPELFAPFVRYWGGVYHSPAIGPRLRAFVALGVAFSQECEYCVGPMTQSALASVIRFAPEAGPRDALCAINAVLYDNVRRRMKSDDHVTFVLLRYHDDGRIVYAGGHEELILWRSGTGRCETVVVDQRSETVALTVPDVPDERPVFEEHTVLSEELIPQPITKRLFLARRRVQ